MNFYFRHDQAETNTIDEALLDNILQ
jgi:hypothetical protein